MCGGYGPGGGSQGRDESLIEPEASSNRSTMQNGAALVAASEQPLSRTSPTGVAGVPRAVIANRHDAAMPPFISPLRAVFPLS